MATFVTHARTLEELRAEFVSDLERRMAALDSEQKFEKRVGRAKEISRARQTLESVAEFWSQVEFRGGKGGRKQP